MRYWIIVKTIEMLTNLASYCVSYLEKNLIFEVLSKVCTLLNIQTNGPSHYWYFGLLVFRTNGALGHWDVPDYNQQAHCCKIKIN